MCSLLDYAENKGIQAGIEQGIEHGVRALIEAGRAFGQSYDSTMDMVIEKYSFDMETAQKKMEQYWQ